MKILIIGGTRFVGHHLAEACLAGGHELTLFHRGQTSRGAYPGVTELIGDREHDLALLDGLTFDAAIDTCAYVPRIAKAAAAALAGRVGHYTFVSTVSVYADFSQLGLSEDSELASLKDETVEEVTGETYGGLKVLCERAVNEHLADRAFHLRPGIIVGPRDPTDRFTYWLKRCTREGEILAPAPCDRTLQAIDARDLANWTLERIEAGFVGVRNAAGPTTTFDDMLQACHQA
ncbi:MAG: Rossmann-fold NAD(P)-binding domain-containing protein, partial [Planctomycetota bacterium]